ncbi:MAG: hypothetical protein IPK37_05620 [Austwickia sp.]|jgi:hypothetical protein|nr:MAG: hypothetical protein IPK37_05620 [Austwickia sp.]
MSDLGPEVGGGFLPNLASRGEADEASPRDPDEWADDRQPGEPAEPLIRASADA